MKHKIANLIGYVVGRGLASIVRVFEPHHPEDEELWQVDEQD